MNLVIIGGGNNGHVRSDGVKTPYEQKEIDDYISTLTNDKFLKEFFNKSIALL